jgi:hypothetical protein
MNECFRQKIKHWLISILSICLLFTWFLTSRWLDAANKSYAYDESIPHWTRALTPVLEFFSFGLFFALCWHIFDFLQSDRISRSAFGYFSRYPVMLLALIVWSMAFFLGVSPWLNDLLCPDVTLPPGVFQFDGCGSWTPDWKYALVYGCSLILCVLVGLKAVVCIASRLKKT